MSLYGGILLLMSISFSIEGDPIPSKYAAVAWPHCNGLDYLTFKVSGRIKKTEIREGGKFSRFVGTWVMKSDTTVSMTVDAVEQTYTVTNYDSITLLLKHDLNLKGLRKSMDSVLANDQDINEINQFNPSSGGPDALGRKWAALRRLKARAIAKFFCGKSIRDAYVSDRSEFVEK